MIYAQFYHLSVPHQWNNYKSEPIEACSDRSVIILDGRSSSDTHHEIAQIECLKRGYIGYSLHKGESFTRSSIISKYKAV